MKKVTNKTSKKETGSLARFVAGILTIVLAFIMSFIAQEWFHNLLCSANYVLECTES